MRLSSKNSLLALLASASLAMLVVLVLIGERAGVAFAFLSVLFPVFLMALGVVRHGDREEGRLGPVAPILVTLVLVLGLATAVLLVLRGQVSNGALPFGLPLVVWLQLVGFWLLPLLLIGVGYAWTFDSHGLREEDLLRLRERWGDPFEGHSGEPRA